MAEVLVQAAMIGAAGPISLRCVFELGRLRLARRSEPIDPHGWGA
jgi:hypothetical protein